MGKLGTNTLVVLSLGATAGAGLIIYFICNERKKRKVRKLRLENNSTHALHRTDGPTGVHSTTQALDITGSSLGTLSLEPDRGVLPEQQGELWSRLDAVLHCVAELRAEVADLRNGLQGIADQIVQDVKFSVEESQKAARKRRIFLPRERTDSMSSSSIYFSASAGPASAYDGESEGGYTTANAESDYNGETDKDTDEEDESCATVRTLRRDSLCLDDDEPSSQLDFELPSDELSLLLAQSDRLHSGAKEEKAEGFHLLLTNKPLYGDSKEFQWRLARSYNDMCEITEDKEERKSYAEQGREEAEAALLKDDQSAECHKWFAVLTGITSHYEGIHGRLKSGHIFKSYLNFQSLLRKTWQDISAKTEEQAKVKTGLFHLVQRCGFLCFLQVSSLGWLEKKAAAALYESPPVATVQEALENFLKAEELSPGFSKAVRVYIAKCYRDLGNSTEVKKWVELASEMPNMSYEVINSTSLEETLEALRENSM
nr:PREDICTED: regulator of microtubule dynamics protein 3 [Lepisosteus oculatus]